MALQNTKAENTPPKPPKNNISKTYKVELVHKTTTIMLTSWDMTAIFERISAVRWEGRIDMMLRNIA
ncbi:MAG: hypothetical protein FWH37_03245 [Candidatus Bathyarchaeota archaeon]|nr:hypothetical protein [Candidatus Termiticorpusculum sp.]